MTRTHAVWYALVIALFATPAACSSPPGAAEQDQLLETAVAGTVQAQVALTVAVASPDATKQPTESQEEPSPSASPSPAATETPTPPPSNPVISVSVNTNCRSGPDAVYDFRGTLRSGEFAEVTARSTVSDYWYIANPMRSGEYCWLWGEYATVSGDTSDLPAYTPVPSPTAALDFNLYLHSFQVCGGTKAVFIVDNTGVNRFKTAQTYVQDLDTGKDLHPRKLDRHPFAPSPYDCPPEHSNVLDPGTGAYIVARIDPVESGNNAFGTVKLCTEDFLGGSCVTKSIYFKLPN